MKHVLFLLLMICGIPVFSQSDFDFSFKTQSLIVYTQTTDSVATAEKQKIAAPGIKVDPVLDYDTITVKEFGLRYFTKQGNNITVYDPQNPTGAVTYLVQYAGWQKALTSIALKYNMVDEKSGNIYGFIVTDPFAPAVFIHTPTRQIDYNCRQ